ncbi:hypothetical protein [Rubritalea sp.]|uniref:hypothetical protein n=1 Tax=Rubritalea sp. TaxID=2109375 RepID=UPI003EF3D5D1
MYFTPHFSIYAMVPTSSNWRCGVVALSHRGHERFQPNDLARLKWLNTRLLLRQLKDYGFSREVCQVTTQFYQRMIVREEYIHNVSKASRSVVLPHPWRPHCAVIRPSSGSRRNLPKILQAQLGFTSKVDSILWCLSSCILHIGFPLSDALDSVKESLHQRWIMTNNVMH